MPGSIVQFEAIAAYNSGTMGSVSLPNPTTTGNTILVVMAGRNGSGTTPWVITDNKGNTYTSGFDGFSLGSGFSRTCGLAYKENANGGSSHTFSGSNVTSGDVYGLIIEVQGVLTASFDQAIGTVDANGGAATAPTTGTLAQANSFLLNFVGCQNGVTSLTPGGAWTEHWQGNFGAPFPDYMALNIQNVSATTPVAPDCTFNTSANFASLMVVLKESAGGGNRRRRTLLMGGPCF